jgi:iron(III) transport system substrate-binding protein
MRRTTLLGTALSLCAAVAASGCSVFDPPADIQVYSARHYDVEDAFKEFEEQTGKSVEFIFDEDAALLERIKAEGDDSPADVYMTVDAGNLWNAADQGVIEAIDSPALDDAVPAEYRDPENRWFGLAVRARTVLYNPDAVDPAEFDAEDTYGGLADPKWSGRLCMRDSQEAYTQSLVASLIALHGEEGARDIVQGWLDNDVQIMSNDILLIEAVDAGTCDVAIVNHYYVARELDEKPDLNVKLFWASQEGEGTHVNISGAGVVATSDNKADAQELIEWLATDGQHDFIGGNHEYPVNPSVEPDELVASFGEFTPMTLDAQAYGENNAAAVALLADLGYDG